MRSWALLWVLGALGITAACGSSSKTPAAAQAGSAGAAPTAGGSGSGGSASSGGASQAEPIELEDLCPIFTQDLCVYLMECQGTRYRDADHCERELDCFGLPQLTAAAERGAVDYDPGQVGACHARFLESPCTFGAFLFTPDIYDVLRFCPGTITPKLQAGESCSSHGECTEGLYCYKGVDYLCPGQCQAFSQEGEDCAGSGSCAEGLQCQSDVCVPRKKAGDPCGDGCNYSLSCPNDEICDGNIWCDREAGTCESGRLVDEPCGSLGTAPNTSLANCAVHLWCDAGPFGAAGTCHLPSAQGGPCNDARFACEDGLHCVGYAFDVETVTLGSCEPPGEAASECAADDDCQDGLSCVLSECRTPGGDGADCGGSGDCQTGLVCVDGVCLSARYPGDACDDMRCTFGRCVEGTCDYHAKVGEACTAPTDCATGECIEGVCYDDSVCNAPEP